MTRLATKTKAKRLKINISGLLREALDKEINSENIDKIRDDVQKIINDSNKLERLRKKLIGKVADWDIQQEKKREHKRLFRGGHGV